MFDTQKLLSSTTLYRSGRPFNTEAVVCSLEKNRFIPKMPPYFEITQHDGGIRLRYDLSKHDRVYGLGQQMGGLNKRGRRYKTFTIDKGPHTPDQEMMYGSHPFLIITGRKHFGLFLDYPSEVLFDIGFTHKDVLEITIPSENFDLYLFDVSDTKMIIREYLQLTGTSYVPPKWAFGYHQSRYGYKDADEIRTVAEQFRKREIPCDAIYLDIDYMDNYKVFTVNESAFPEFTQMVNDLREDGFQSVPIIDAAVKVEDGYNIYEEGKAKQYFCIDADEKEFVCGVWPGSCVLPDFLRSEVRSWWAQHYSMFTESGIHGFWNDMNEPAIFYTPEKLQYVAKRVDEIFHEEIHNGMKFMLATADLGSIFNRREYFRQFHHTTSEGEVVNHENVHNLYGFNMVRSAVEGFETFLPGKRYFLISRSSYAGQHRFSGIWTGDNNSWWEHLLLNIRMLMSLNLSGFLYAGADIGGFGSEISPELMIRWMQTGVFSPLCRNHTWFGARDQEPWAFDDECTSILRHMIRLRYALLPYTYTEYMRAVRDLEPFITPLFVEFKNERAQDIEDQFLYGQSLMVAPIYTPNARGRYVFLPESRWLYWKAACYEDRQMVVMQPGDQYVEAGIHEIPVFLRENHLLVLTEPSNYVGEKPIETLTVVGFVTDNAEFTYYEDDGETLNYQNGAYATLTISIRKEGDTYQVNTGKDERNGWALSVKQLHCEIYDEHGEMSRITVGI